ncbi:MAG: MaoC family dehydratase [bacterium]|nr:MaoC family dehydratase [bacterium]
MSAGRGTDAAATPSPPPAAGHAVQVGDDLPQRIIESVDAEKMKTMAALLGDPNTIHWDVDDVRRLGLGDRPVNQGPNNMGYVIDMLADWAGGPANFRRVKVRFLGNVFAEDRLVAGGKVTGVRPGSGGRLVDCDVWLARNGTEAVLAGTATVLLPD